ncbi:ParB/RepB/Spo0J family partition protein [uncultured Roseibium sp.]|uniref:ParB/RepB/Spo0J family partition protein n=1 Tax=uncultured Roseibium sp. TaxID=1936171 RepID=UPI0026046854|nr:ParB/RepB/Spo0J family partition protein [uncultured Roseibium sp.]
MASANQKITLASSRDIPFNKLVLSQSNVRRIKAGVSIEELAESIARRGLIQSLHVRPVLNGEGAETGLFEVPAGGRRFRALELLVKQKRLNKSAPVPCVVSDANNGILIDEVSLAENIERAPLHPLDQFRAFLSLREKGMSDEEIAAAFFVSAQVVKQRLRLTSVAPSLLDVYAGDDMTLEQLMAFTVSDDHARQQQVWEALQHSWQKEPYQIRRMLTENTVRAADRRVRFVGLEAYETAGGTVLRDLFEDDQGGWVEDVPLLECLVADKLKAEAETITAEGWKWIEVSADFPYGHTQGLRRLQGTALDLTDEDHAMCQALRDEQDRLEAEYAETDELPDEVDARLGEIEETLEAFENRPLQYDAGEIAYAGVFVSIRHDGQLAVERGFVRPEDEATEECESRDASGERDDAGNATNPAAHHTVISVGGEVDQPEDEVDDGIKPLPDRLVTELTAERTLALRNKLADSPSIAFLAVLHKFCRDVFSRYISYNPAMEVSLRNTGFSLQAPGLSECPAAQAIEERHKAWEARLPADEAALWDWLISLDGTEQAELFAHCAAFGVNALHEKADRYGGGTVTAHGIEQRLTEANRLARATGLDMVEAGWQPTVANYLGRVTKARILEAVREGAGEDRVQLIDHLKKDDMAREAERLLADTGWLPEPLRLTGEPVDQVAEAPVADERPGDKVTEPGEDEAVVIAA